MTESEQIAQWTKWEAGLPQEMDLVQYMHTIAVISRKDCESAAHYDFVCGAYDAGNGIQWVGESDHYAAGHRAGTRLAKRFEGK